MRALDFGLRASGFRALGIRAFGFGFGSRFGLRLRLLNKTRNFIPVEQSTLATDWPRSGGM